LVITPVNAGTATITVTATDSHGAQVSTTMQVTIQAAATKSLFFSEVVYGHDYLQGFEIYNPTGETINGSRITIKRSDGGANIVINGCTLNPGQAFVMMEVAYDGDAYVDGWKSMHFYDNDTVPVTLSLYLDGVLLDVAEMHPYQSLARQGGVLIGTTSYDSSQWTDEGDDYIDDLGSYTP
ncbi:MAG: hypothetical protein ACXVP5_12530, partial [Tumebacillaceae bacterium]